MANALMQGSLLWSMEYNSKQIWQEPWQPLVVDWIRAFENGAQAYRNTTCNMPHGMQRKALIVQRCLHNVNSCIIAHMRTPNTQHTDSRASVPTRACPVAPHGRHFFASSGAAAHDRSAHQRGGGAHHGALQARDVLASLPLLGTRAAVPEHDVPGVSSKRPQAYTCVLLLHAPDFVLCANDVMPT